MRRFELWRHKDVSGVSGTGIVAKGCVFYSRFVEDGPEPEHVVLTWIREPQSISIWRSIEELLSVHGHGTNAEIRWIDDEHEWQKHPHIYANPAAVARSAQESDPD